MAQQFPVPDESGSVPTPPVQPFSYQPVQPSPQPPKNNRRTLWIVLIVLLVLCVCVVAVGALLYFVVGDMIINILNGSGFLGQFVI